MRVLTQISNRRSIQMIWLVLSRSSLYSEYILFKIIEIIIILLGYYYFFIYFCILEYILFT